MNRMSRRQALGGFISGSLGAVAFSQDVSGEQQERIPDAFKGQHQPKPLPFDPAKLTGISEKLIRSHWENNYGGSVRALNAVEQRLSSMMKEKDLPAFVYGDLKREELIRTGSVVLHELYFANLVGTEKLAATPSS